MITCIDFYIFVIKMILIMLTRIKGVNLQQLSQIVRLGGIWLRSTRMMDKVYYKEVCFYLLYPMWFNKFIFRIVRPVVTWVRSFKKTYRRWQIWNPAFARDRSANGLLKYERNTHRCNMYTQTDPNVWHALLLSILTSCTLLIPWFETPFFPLFFGLGCFLKYFYGCLVLINGTNTST